MTSLQFEIRPSSGVPIYRQIMDQVRALAASERLKPGELLPSVRQLAAELEINMMTVSKAYARLEAEGLVERIRGRGMRIVGQKTAGRVADRQAELADLADALVTRGQQLGLTEAQILATVKTVFKERRQ